MPPVVCTHSVSGLRLSYLVSTYVCYSQGGLKHATARAQRHKLRKGKGKDEKTHNLELVDKYRPGEAHWHLPKWLTGPHANLKNNMHIGEELLFAVTVMTHRHLLIL